MATSFLGQRLALKHLLLAEGAALTPGCHRLSEELDPGMAALQLHALGVKAGTLAPDQLEYSKAWAGVTSSAHLPSG